MLIVLLHISLLEIIFRTTRYFSSTKGELSQLCRENIEAFERYIETLILKAYSPSTIRTYKNEFFQLLKELKKIPVSNLTCKHIRRYMYYCLDRYKLSEATANSRINAIKLYFEQVLGRERMLIELPRPKMPLLFTTGEISPYPFSLTYQARIGFMLKGRDARKEILTTVRE
ncbi:phage integrase N-terminal SAM-like domain-containing protein [Segetibacter koreensis]|uniref:phage integrase N-terminal SAM-like domain-containing protein n=1 Tax=Segetibacter koreensis TaxID=398037 RepID=UPI00036C27FF|nr:phage integrase N-terminal SAM-like domain-containing protein [Segetibacter koreensis]